MERRGGGLEQSRCRSRLGGRARRGRAACQEGGPAAAAGKPYDVKPRMLPSCIEVRRGSLDIWLTSHMVPWSTHERAACSAVSIVLAAGTGKRWRTGGAHGGGGIRAGMRPSTSNPGRQILRQRYTLRPIRLLLTTPALMVWY